MNIDLDSLDFSKSAGLVTVVVQNATSGTVLMVAHADREALEKTIETGEMHFRSRTRGHWHKGATSGNIQKVVTLSADCDSDAVLARVIPTGPACHTMSESCFGNSALSADAFSTLNQTIQSRASALGELSESSAESYTQQLLINRNLRLKKIGEEAAELIVALADDDRHRVAEEAADLIYHVLVATRSVDVDLKEIQSVLAERAK